MDESPHEPGSEAPDQAAEVEAPAVTTVEAEVRAQVADKLGGPRGGIETALPFAAFTVVYVVIEELAPALIVGVAAAVLLLAARLVQRSTTQFVNNGLAGIAVAAVLATVTGRAETAFLPGIIQSAAWAAVLGISILARWPLVGFLVGAVVGETTAWRDDPAIVRLGNRLTLVMMVPMVLRVAVQYPLYLAGEVGWLGVTRIALGWPLSLVAFFVAAAILARGRTPLRRRPGQRLLTAPSAVPGGDR